MFNILQFIENLVGIGKTPTTPATPSTFQSAVDTAGKALDIVENAMTTLQGLASVLPPPYQGYVAAAAVTFHGLDSYVDTLETQPAPVAPAAPVPAPPPVAA